MATDLRSDLVAEHGEAAVIRCAQILAASAGQFRLSAEGEDSPHADILERVSLMLAGASDA